MSSTLVHLDLRQFEAPCYGGVCFTQPYISSLLSPIWLPTLSHYHTSGPEHCSHPAVLISPRAVPHVLSSWNGWQATWLIPFYAVSVGLQETHARGSQAWNLERLQLLKPHTLTWRLIPWENFIPMSRIDIARETTKSTNNKILSASQLQIII